MDLFPVVEFRRCVERHRGNHKVQRFSCLEFLCLAFAQLTSRESLRDIEVCLRAVHPRLYHMGFRGNISRNTLANANLKRDWRIYAEVAQILIRQARQLYSHEDLGLELDQTVYALDSTHRSVLVVVPTQQAAVKVHTVICGAVSPALFTCFGAPAMSACWMISCQSRGLLCDGPPFISPGLTLAAFFVVRALKNMQYRRRYCVDKTTGLRSDRRSYLPATNDYPGSADPLLGRAQNACAS